MSALEARLHRGLEALNRHDLDAAQTHLDEVALVPGAAQPISGLCAASQARFFELAARIAAAQDNRDAAQDALNRMGQIQFDAGLLTEDDLLFDDDPEDLDDLEDPDEGCGCGCPGDCAPDLDLQPEHHITHFENIGLQGYALVEELRDHHHRADADHSALTTVELRRATLVLDPHEAPSPSALAALNLPADHDPDWIACEVEELRVLRTTLRYRSP